MLGVLELLIDVVVTLRSTPSPLDVEVIVVHVIVAAIAGSDVCKLLAGLGCWTMSGGGCGLLSEADVVAVTVIVAQM